MKYLYAALTFLTIIPAPSQNEEEEADLAKAVKFFPVIGSIVGLISALVAALSLVLVDPLSAVIITVAVMTLISGGLHMDGLADTFDGFLSARPRLRKLEIMHDSRIGAMGVLAILFVVLLKISLLFALSSNPALLVAVIFLMPLAGRVSQVVSMSLLPYARDEGLGLLFWKSDEARARPALLALVVVAIVVCGFSNQRCLSDGLFLTIWILVVVALFSRWCDKVIEGGTGDTLGACTELVELATVFYFVVC